MSILGKGRMRYEHMQIPARSLSPQPDSGRERSPLRIRTATIAT